MQESELLSHLSNIQNNGRLASYDMLTGREITSFNRQVMASYLLNQNLAVIENRKWWLTQLGRQMLETAQTGGEEGRG